MAEIQLVRLNLRILHLIAYFRNHFCHGQTHFDPFTLFVLTHTNNKRVERICLRKGHIQGKRRQKNRPMLAPSLATFQRNVICSVEPRERVSSLRRERLVLRWRNHQHRCASPSLGGDWGGGGGKRGPPISIKATLLVLRLRFAFPAPTKVDGVVTCCIDGVRLRRRIIRFPSLPLFLPSRSRPTEGQAGGPVVFSPNPPSLLSSFLEADSYNDHRMGGFRPQMRKGCALRT